MKALAVRVGVFFAGLCALRGEELRITDVLMLPGGAKSVRYESAQGGTFVLLRGDDVTRIQTPVATNLGAAGPMQFDLPAASGDGPQFFRIRHFEGPSQDLTVFTTSPGRGEAGVAVTRETVVRFTNPLAADTLISTELMYAEFGGRRLLARAHLSVDRRTATLFYLEPLPASARIQVHLMGDGLFDDKGRLVDADADGVQGGNGRFEFETLSIVPVGRTAMVGRVYASELALDPTTPGVATNLPLAGVTITVDGAEETLRAVTDAQGYFRLQPCPAGSFFVHIDGRTSPLSRYPAGDFYPTVGKEWVAAAGRTNNLAGGTGEIFLPRIRAGSLQRVSATEATTVAFAEGVIAANPALAGVTITVPANALFSESGVRGGARRDSAGCSGSPSWAAPARS